MQKSTYIAATQDKLHIQVFLLIKPATYQSRVVCLFLQSLPTLCLWGPVYESPETPKEVFSLLKKKHIWPPTYDHWNHNFSTLQWYINYIHSVETLFRILTFPWARRKWQPTPVFLPGKSHGQRAGYSPWGRKESDTTRATVCWASNMWYATLSWYGQWRRATAASQPHNHQYKQLIH